MIFSAVLLVLAIGLLWRHVRVWNSIKSSGFGANDLDFFRRQFRRRVQTTCTMGAVATCLGVFPFISNKIAALIFMIVVTLLVFWISFSALLDLMSTRSYLDQIRQSQQRERAKLEAEINKLRTANRNGDE